MSTHSHDVVVVGGGPAGSSAARRAAQLGLSVLLLEKKTMPRRKPCGGALSEQALSYLGLDVPRHLINSEGYGARLHFAGRTLSCRKSERIAVLVTRARFDHYLLEEARAAGCDVRFAEARAIEQDADGVTVTTPTESYRASFAIVAVGATGTLISSVRRRDGSGERAFSMEAEIPVAVRNHAAESDGLIDIRFGVARYGYGWVFDHRSYHSVGVGGMQSRFDSPRETMRGFLESLGYPPDPPGIRGHFIPAGGIKRRTASGRVLLAGDSGGFVDSFYGEGLAYAIRSGQLAAEVTHRYSNERHIGAHVQRAYSQRCREEFERDLGYSLLFTRLMHFCPSLFLRLLVCDKRFLAKFLDIPLRHTTYRRFLLWMLPRLPLLFGKLVSQQLKKR